MVLAPLSKETPASKISPGATEAGVFIVSVIAPLLVLSPVELAPETIAAEAT